ncbi:MAG: mechanosensitive ion channel family protein [Rhodobacteraceae bacterium]|nr:mechanosensitive ion channel family protein [Paracoccaceae bacterium]
MRVALNNWFRILALLACLVAVPALAQEDAKKALDFDEWARTAERAERIIENAEASSTALEALRTTLSEFRTKALALQDSNQARIDTLRSQLAALGPPPAEGEIEAAEVAQRRSELNDQLAKARAPVLAAQEAYKRANGMIGEIDAIIRERLADQLFTLGVSPVNPAHWPEAYSIVAGYLTDVREEIDEGMASQAQMVMTRQNLPVILLLAVIGLLLMTRARHWLISFMGLMPIPREARAGEARSLLLSVTQVVVPMLGVAALLQAVNLSGMTGLRGQNLIVAVPWMALSILGGRWLGRTLFTETDGTPLFLGLKEADARTGLRIASALGIVVALDHLLETLATQVDFTDTAQIVLSFPIVVVAGLLLVRFGLLLDPARQVLEPGQEANPLRRRLYGLITRTTIVLGVTGPLLAAIGYFTASTSFVFPMIKTLALIGLGLILYRLLNDLAETLLQSAQGKRRDETDEGLSLVPVALGSMLIIAALPVLALIWGARVSDLLEIWTMINDGFAFGDNRISVSVFLTFAIVFAAGYTLTRLLQSTLRSTVLPRTRMDAGGRNAILTGTGYVGIFLAGLAAVTSAGLDLSGLAIVAGALSVGIGFGLQAIVSNFVSGIILLIERPIKEGDWIEVGAYSGYVRKISVRSTEIDTFDRATVVVPNADFISGTVINYTHSSMNGRVKVPVGVAYDSDTRQVEKILLEVAESHDMVDHRFNVNVVFLGFGADSMDFEIRAVLKDVNYVLAVKSDMNHEIARRFREEGIEIPFAQRDINVRNIDALVRAIREREDKA